MALTRNDKNKILKNILAGFYRRKNVFDIEKEERQMLDKLKNDIFYRGRPLDKRELIKPENKEHKKRLRKEEEILGIRAYV